MAPTATVSAATRCDVAPHARAAVLTVADAMVTDVKLSDSGTTVRELRGLFEDEHVHAAVILAGGVLVTVVDRADVEGSHRDDAVALHLGRRQSRVIAPEADLEQARRFLLASGRRRLAVVGADGSFRGLLCLKRTRKGFCSDMDIYARVANSHRPAPDWPPA